MKALTLAACLALALPAHAGGPVVVEDETEVVAPRAGMSPGEKVGLILGLVIIGGLIAGGGGGGGGGEVPCYAPENPDTPDC